MCVITYTNLHMHNLSTTCLVIPPNYVYHHTLYYLYRMLVKDKNNVNTHTHDLDCHVTVSHS